MTITTEEVLHLRRCIALAAEALDAGKRRSGLISLPIQCFFRVEIVNCDMTAYHSPLSKN